MIQKFYSFRMDDIRCIDENVDEFTKLVVDPKVLTSRLKKNKIKPSSY